MTNSTKMNCLDFRRSYLTDPYHLEPEQVAHTRECEPCARLVERHKAEERKLAAALNVAVPKGLGAHVVFEHSMRGRRGVKVFAVAAVALLTLAASFGVFLYQSESAIERDFLAHMQKDPMHMQSANAEAGANLQRVAADLGIKFDGDFGQVKVIGSRLCDVDGQHSAHFVVEEGGIRATAFLVPDKSLAGLRLAESALGDSGMLVATDGGLIAVFCPERKMLVRVSEQLRRSVQWSS